MTMKTTPKTILGLALVASCLAACNGGGDTGVPAAVTNEIQGLAGVAKAAGGDYAKLSDADKQKFIERAGNETEAQKMVARMGTAPRAPAKP